MAHLTTAESENDLDLVSVLEKTDGVVYFCLEIVSVDAAGQLHLLDLDDVLLLFRFLLPLVLLKAVAAVVGDPADGRLGAGGDHDEIQAGVVGDLKRALGRHNAELLAFLIDDSNFLASDGFVDKDILGCYCFSPPEK